MTGDRIEKIATREHGFTLLEVLAVLSLLALAAMIAMPRGDGPRQSRVVQSAAIGLAAELKSARAAAIRSNTEQTLTIDADARHYAREGWSEPRALPPTLAIAFDTIRGEQSTSSAGRIRFYPDGSATGGRVVLSHGKQRVVVSIDWLTGGTRVSVEN